MMYHLRKILAILSLVIFPIFGFCQIIHNNNEAIFVLRSFKINQEIDTVNLHLEPGKYYIKLVGKDNINADFDIQAIDINSKEYEIKMMDSLRYIEVEKPTYMHIVVRLKNKSLLNSFVSVGLAYPLNPNLTFPSFVIKDINGIEVTSESLIGKIIVINFWGLFCKPCIEEIPRLNHLAKSYASDDDIEFFALSPDSKDKVNKFLEKRHFNYRMFVGKKNLEIFKSSINLFAIPLHVIIDKEGNLAFNFYGYNKDIDIDKLLKERIEALK